MVKGAMMKRYIAILDGAQGAFGVSFPDCPGCVAMGELQNEAYANAISDPGAIHP
jgi:predicted RNase H-like HicB family nuclease